MDGQHYNLSSLIRRIIERATGQPPRTQPWGPNWYRDDTDQTLAKIARTPHAVRRVLQQALVVRDARQTGELDAAEVASEAVRLGAAVDKLLVGRTWYASNRRLLDHLSRERDALFTFLVRPGVEVTNWRAEHAIRPAVVSRKQWGGNATWTGATAWQILPSVLRTAAQQQRDPVVLLAGLLRAPGPVVADLAIPTPARGP